MTYDPLGDDDHTDANERTQVVEWLRRIAKTDYRHGEGGIATATLLRAADDIERGRHYIDAPQDSEGR